MQTAGLEGFRYNPLPADPDAKGPTLFAASGKRVAAATRSSRKKADAVPLMKTA
jgi:BRCT domain type II-containing protein